MTRPWHARFWMGRPEDGAISYSVGASYDLMPSLDGMRAISFLIVLVSHCGFGFFVPGGFGVTVFFFVSGLLITRQLLAEMARTHNVRLLHFTMRRFLRLYPPLLVMIAVMVPCFMLFGGPVLRVQVVSALLYFANYATMIFNWGADPAYRNGPLDILWSLAVEEHFYLLFPLSLLPFRRHLGGIAPALLVVIGLFLLWRFVLAGHCENSTVGVCMGGLPDRIAGGTDTRGDSILYGALFATLLDGRYAAAVLRLFRARLALPLGLVILVFSLAVRDSYFRDTLRYSVQGIGLMMATGAILYGEHLGLIRRVLSTPVARFVGRLSYSLYLYHWAVVVCWLQWHFGHVEPSAPEQAAWLRAALPMIAAVSLVLASLSYYGVERPTLRLRKQWGSHSIADNALR